MANLSNINNKFLVTNTGEVLIGQTANNGNRLQITGADGASYIYLKTDVATTGGRIGFNGDDLRVFNQQASGELHLGTAGSTKMIIDSSGKVGIGGGTIEGKLSIDYTAAELPTSGTTSNSAIQVTSSLNNQLNLGLNTVSGGYGAYIQASDNNLAVPYPLNLQPNGGNVGIGTTTPNAKLHIYGSASLSEMYLGEDAAADKAGILKYTQGNGSGTGVVTLSHWGNNSLTEGLAIKYGGNVGIGTTDPSVLVHAVASGTKISPLGGTVLGVQNDSSTSLNCWISALAGNAGAAALVLGDTDDNDQARFQFNNSGRLLQMLNAGSGITVISSGNVGIGTTSPNQKLVVQADWNGSLSNNQQVQIQGNTDTTLQLRLGYDTTNDYAEIAALKSGTGYKNLILNRGGANVGIGTSSPSAKLEINGALFVGNHTGTVTPTSGIFIEEAAGVDTQIQMYTYGGSVFRIKGSEIKADIGWGSSQNRSVNFNNTGTGSISVGIGTDSPTGKFNSYISATRQLTHNGNGGDLSIISDNNSSPVMFIKGTGNADLLNVFDNTTEVFTILDGGNVGIGTDSPGDAKLYVNGGTTLGGTNNTSSGSFNVYGDRKYPQATYFVKRNYKLASGSSNLTFNIARQWHDHANWGLGNINIIMWGIYYGHSNQNKADFSCRYGYGGGTADAQANFNPGSLPTPTWTAATQVSGNTHYRDLQITIPAYQQISFEIISPGLQQTYNVNNTAGNTVYLYPH